MLVKKIIESAGAVRQRRAAEFQEGRRRTWIGSTAGIHVDTVNDKIL